MKKLALVLGLLLCLCAPAHAQVQASFSLNLVNGTPSTVPWTLTTANPGSNGQLTVSNAGTATTGIFGIARDNLNPGTGIVSVIYSGLTYCTFDTPTVTQLNYVVAAGTAGQCHQVTSYPTSGQVIGRVVGSQLAANIFQIVLYPPEIRGGAGGSGVSCPACTTNNVMLWTGTLLANSSITDNGGVTIGSPTGGAKGVGTLNATALYSNGNLINPSNNNISSYVGSVGITGNQGNGLDQISKLCVNGVCPVTAFGATGDGTHDDTLAIQTAFNTAAAANASVYFPHASVCYRTSYPLIDGSVANVTTPIFGESAYDTQICASGGLPGYPVLVHYPLAYLTDLGTIKGASLVTGSTNSLAFTGGVAGSMHIALNDAMDNFSGFGFSTGQFQHPLNGQTSLTIDGWVQWDPTSNTTYTIFASGGNDGADPNASDYTTSNSTPHTLLQVSGDGSVAGQFFFGLDIAGTLNSVTAATALTKNTPHYIRAVLDPNSGTPKMCLYVDTAQVGSVTTVSGGTTMKQRIDEAMTIGGFSFGPSQWPESGGQNGHWLGKMFPLRIQASALNACSAATITVPTAPLTAGTLPIFLNNGNAGEFGTPAMPTANVVANSDEALAGGYAILRDGAQMTQGASAEIHDLNLTGGSSGLIVMASPQTKLARVSVNASRYMGVLFESNTYSSRIDDLTCTSASTCLAFASVADAEVRNLQSTGSNYAVSAQYGLRLYGHIDSPGAGAVGGSLALSCVTDTCGYIISGYGSDVETATGSYIPIKIAGTFGQYLIEGVDLQTNAATNIPGIYYNGFGNASTASIDIIGTHYEGGTPAEIFDVLSGTTPFTWINPIVNGKLWSSNTTIPMTNEVDPNVNNAVTTCASGCYVTVQGH